MTKRLRLSTNIQEIVQINPSSVTCMTLPPPPSPLPLHKKSVQISLRNFAHSVNVTVLTQWSQFKNK